MYLFARCFAHKYEMNSSTLDISPVKEQTNTVYDTYSDFKRILFCTCNPNEENVHYVCSYRNS